MCCVNTVDLIKYFIYNNCTCFIFHATLNLNYDRLSVLILRAEFYVILSVK